MEGKLLQIAKVEKCDESYIYIYVIKNYDRAKIVRQYNVATTFAI